MYFLKWSDCMYLSQAMPLQFQFLGWVYMISLRLQHDYTDRRAPRADPR
jgi:hypothetical protein